MKFTKRSIIFFLMIIFFMQCGFTGYCGEAADKKCFYVSTAGSDNYTGSFEEPFLTPQKAIEAVRQYKDTYGLPDGGIYVYFRGGNYYLTQSLQLTKEDSGSESSPITYSSYPNEEAHFIGGKEIDVKKFTLVNDGDILYRLPVESRGKVYSVNLKEQGITDYGTIAAWGTYNPLDPTSNIYVNGEKMTLARWPNDGYTNTGTVQDEGSKDVVLGKRPDNAHGAVFGYSDDRVARWKGAKDAWLYGYWQNGWSVDTLKIKDVDIENKTIQTENPAVFGVAEGKRYYAYNLIEELDAPGEWYIDRNKGVLYYYPTQDFKDMTMLISDMRSDMIKLSDTNYITLKNLEIECAQGCLVKIEGGTNNTVKACTIRGAGGRAVWINGGYYNGITGCDIYDVDGDCIGISGGKAEKNILDLSYNFIDNCHLHHFGRLNTTSGAILARAHGARITHNKIHAGPHQAIGFSGFELDISYNEIYDVLRETEDAGAIYTGRTLASRGDKIYYNYIHDICGIGEYGNGGYMGIYLDDYFAGADIQGNVFYNVSTPIFGHHGAQSIVKNNIMISNAGNSQGAIWWSDGGQEYNYKTLKDGGQATLVNSWKSIDWAAEPFASMYPEVQKVTMENILNPFDNVFEANVAVNHKTWNFAPRVKELSFVGKNYETVEDPGFVNFNVKNFNLKEDSVIYTELPDFQPIPFDKIGLYVNDDRPALPENENVDKFTLTSPYNGEENVSAKEITFKWNNCPKLGVDRYRLTISEDEAFENIVCDMEVQGTSAVVDLLDVNKKYYWKAAGISGRGENRKMYYNSDGVKSFSTSYYKPDEIVVENKITDITEMLKDQKGWQEGSCKTMDFKDGNVKFTSESCGVGGYQGAKTELGELLHFGAKIENSAWVGFATQAANTDTPGWVKNSHYLVIMKPDSIELHKYPENGKGAKMLASIERKTPFDEKQVHDILFGTYVSGKNVYMVFALDGEIIFQKKDNAGDVIKNPGWFALYNVQDKTGSNALTITPPISKAPEIKIEDSDLADEFTPYLTGGTALRIGSPLAYINLKKKQINNKNLMVEPILENDAALVPLRFISEGLGAEVCWKENENTIEVTKNDSKIGMTLGKTNYTVNGEEKETNVTPRLIEDTVYVPLRVIGELFDYMVHYSENGLILIIPKGNPMDIFENDQLIENLAALFY